MLVQLQLQAQLQPVRSSNGVLLTAGCQAIWAAKEQLHVRPSWTFVTLMICARWHRRRLLSARTLQTCGAAVA